MRTFVALGATILLAVACGAPTAEVATTTAAPSTTTTTPAADTTVVVVPTTTTTEAASSGPELVLSSISLGQGAMVVITNIGDETASLSGHFFCQRPNYAALPDVELPAGKSLAVSAGGSILLPPPGAIVAEDPVDLGGLSPGGGEVGLYSSSNFNDPGEILSYVEWGSAGHGRSQVAIDAGIWDGFVATTGGTTALIAEVLPATSAAAWGAFGD